MDVRSEHDQQGGWAPDQNPSGTRSLAELSDWFQGRPAEMLRQVPGRETFVVPAPGRGPLSTVGGAAARRWVIKRFEGPLTGERWYARWWNPDRRGPAQREFESLLWLAQRGLCVPRPIGWVQAGTRSLVAMEYAEHRTDLRAALSGDARLWSRVRVPLRRWVQRLHGSRRGPQAAHRDLYLQHFLIGADPRQGTLIDVGRLLIGDPLRQRWIEKDLAALAHSCPDSVTELQRLAWLGAYLRRRDPGRDRRQQRRELWLWARRIERRRQRMAQHRPRFGEASADA